MWVQFALIAAQMFLGEVTRPRPKKVGFEEFQRSNAPSEVRPIVYMAGTEELTPSRIWYGDYKARAVERDSHWTDYLFFGLSAAILDTITVGYRYYCAEVFSLCYGPDTHVERITIQERIVTNITEGTDNAGGGFLIDDPAAWGGDQPPGEGGQYSWCDVTRGNYTDPTNAYLEGVLSTPPNRTPSLRGVSALISRGSSGPGGFTESGYFAAGGIGFIPRFREWKVVGRRQPNNLATPYSKIGRHANAMEVVYEWARSDEYGAKLPVSEINLASLQSVAQLLHEENNGWSGKIETATQPIEVCRDVAKQVDVIFDPSPSLGWTARAIRRDYSFASLPVMNKDVITRTDRYSPGAYEDTVNKFQLKVGDQNNNFKDRYALYIDPANQVIQGGRIIPRTEEYQGVADMPTGNLLVTRDGRALAFPRGPLTCWVKPSFGKLRYRGEVVRWEWTNPTFSKLMRIRSITPGLPTDPDYKLVCLEDRDATGARTFGEPSGTSHVDPAAGLNVAPPSITWNDVDFPPNGLVQVVVELVDGSLNSFIEAGIIFGSYASGAQYARVYVTEPGGVETLSPMRLAPDADNEATFRWPALTTGEYTFCVQSFSLRDATSGVKVCASIEVTALELRLMEDGTTRLLEDSSARVLE